MTVETVKNFIDKKDIQGMCGGLRKHGVDGLSLATINEICHFLDNSQSETTVASYRIACLRNFTLEPLLPYLKVRLFADLQGKAEFTLTGYADWMQQMHDPHSVFRMARFDCFFIWLLFDEVSVDLSLRYSSLKPAAIQQEIERVMVLFLDLVKTIRTFSSAPILMSNFFPVAYPALGLFDSAMRGGQNEAIRMINERLSALARSESGVHVFDVAQWAVRTGLENLWDNRFYLLVRNPIHSRQFHGIAHECARHLRPILSSQRKCLIVDLDNTLWGGIVGEEGIENIRLGEGYPGNAYVRLQYAILDLYNRGILLAICSKNNPEDAMRVLKTHPNQILRPEHFVAIQINWEEKSNNIKRIAENLNVGLESLVYIDDSPAECLLIQQLLPDVKVIQLPADPEQYERIIREIDEFETFYLSEEDRQRGGLYQSQSKRESLKQQSGSLEDYYQSLQMNLKIRVADDFLVPRIAQLCQKTNQFNLTTKRYTETEIESFSRREDMTVFSLQVQDKFGDSGIAGVAIIHYVEGGASEIDTFLLSCRILGRTIEVAFLASLLEWLKSHARYLVLGWYHPTAKNQVAKNFYNGLGFYSRSQTEEKQCWEIDLRKASIPIPKWFSIV